MKFGAPCLVRYMRNTKRKITPAVCDQHDDDDNHDNDENSATIMCTTMEPPKTKQSSRHHRRGRRCRRRRRLRVRFDEQANVIIDSPVIVMTKQEQEQTWYSRQDIASFQRQTHRQAFGMWQSHPAAHVLNLVYQTFLTVHHPLERAYILDATDLHLEAETCGLELFIIYPATPSCDAGRRRRRRHLLQQLLCFQNAYFLTAQQRAADMARVASQETQASRMFARYIGHIAAQSQQQEKSCADAQAFPPEWL